MKTLICRRTRWSWISVGLLAFNGVLASSTSAQKAISEVYVISGGDRPSIGVVDLNAPTLIDTIVLKPDPTDAVIGASGRFLYVLHNGLFTSEGNFSEKPASLSIVDLESRRLARTVPLGWHTSAMLLTSGDRYLLCFSQGWPETKTDPAFWAQATIIDTTTNEVVAMLRPGKLAKEMAITKDGARLYVVTGETAYGGRQRDAMFVMSRNGSPALKRDTANLSVYQLPGGRQLAVTRIDRTPVRMALSPDERQVLVYTVDERAKNLDPKLRLVDAATLEVVSSPEGGTPMELDESASARAAALTDLKLVGQIIGQRVELPGLNKEVYPLTDAWTLQPAGEVLMVDLRNRRRQMITTGQKGYGERGTGQKVAELGAGIVFPVYGMLHSLANPLRTGRVQSGTLAVRSDGRYFYALTNTNDVAVVRSDDGAVIQRIPTSERARSILLAPTGNYVVVQTPRRIVWIDTRTNQVRVDQAMAHDTTTALFSHDVTRRVLLLTHKSVFIWDAEYGRLIDTVKGIQEPFLALWSR